MQQSMLVLLLFKKCRESNSIAELTGDKVGCTVGSIVGNAVGVVVGTNVMSSTTVLCRIPMENKCWFFNMRKNNIDHISKDNNILTGVTVGGKVSIVGPNVGSLVGK
jgi:hypothetical protein